MKNVYKLFFLAVFALMPLICSAQYFSITELVELAQNENGDFERVVTARGFRNPTTLSNGMSKDLVFWDSRNSKICLTTPSFDTTMRIVSWDFTSLAIFNDLKAELETDGFELSDTERHNGGGYESLFYERPDIEVILTADKTVDSRGIYSVSVKCIDSADYIDK